MVLVYKTDFNVTTHNNSSPYNWLSCVNGTTLCLHTFSIPFQEQQLIWEGIQQCWPVDNWLVNCSACIICFSHWHWMRWVLWSLYLCKMVKMVTMNQTTTSWMAEAWVGKLVNKTYMHKQATHTSYRSFSKYMGSPFDIICMHNLNIQWLFAHLTRAKTLRIKLNQNIRFFKNLLVKALNFMEVTTTGILLTE